MKHNLKQTLEIAETASDPKTKLQARAIANDCYRYIMDLCTNAGIVSDALKFVTQRKEQLDTMQKIDERIEDMEDEKTTNGILNLHITTKQSGRTCFYIYESDARDI